MPDEAEKQRREAQNARHRRIHDKGYAKALQDVLDLIDEESNGDSLWTNITRMLDALPEEEDEWVDE